MSDFEILKLLGTGRFGQVYFGKVKSSGQFVAIKSVFKNENKSFENGNKNESFENKSGNESVKDDVDSMTREIDIHSGLAHQNILKIFGRFEYDDRIYLILVSIQFNGP